MQGREIGSILLETPAETSFFLTPTGIPNTKATFERDGRIFKIIDVYEEKGILVVEWL